MVVFAWSGFPQYAARCVGAFVDQSSEGVSVIATRPAVPIHGMEQLCHCSVEWVEPDGITAIQINDVSTLIVSGWGIPIFDRLATSVRAAGGKVIAMVDNNFRPTIREYVRAIRFRLFLRRKFDAFFVPGRSSRRLLRFYGVPEEKIFEGVYSADGNLFHDGAPLAKREKRVVYVGQLVERKNVRRLCKAFNAANKLGEWTLELYGCGVLEGELRRDYESETIHIHSFLQPEDLAVKYREARVFCLPSLEEHWGVVVHEAALSGCVLLLSDEIGAGEDFLDDANGLTFRADDTYGLTSAFSIIFAMKNKELEIAQLHSIENSRRSGVNVFVSTLRRICHG